MKQIKLTQGKFALVDDADYEWLSQFKWYVDEMRTICYARAMIGRKAERMHRLILGFEPGDRRLTDHIDGDGLNNQRHNLRECDHSQNLQNKPKHKGKSRYKGVSWEKRQRKWIAVIKTKTKRIHLGSFEDDIEAAKIYDKAAGQYFGEFACLNFPERI